MYDLPMEKHEMELVTSTRTLSCNVLLHDRIEIEIVHNMYRMNRQLSLGPPNYAMQEAYKSWLDHYPPMSNLFKGCWGFLLPPGEYAMRGGGSVQ
jgi:hypothetical protein